MSDMNKEKRAEIIQDALEYLDDDMIENVDKLRMGTQAPVKNTGRIKTFFSNSSHYLTVAASVCLLLIGAFAWGNVIGPSNSMDAPMGTESVGGNHHKPEMDGDFFVDGTEEKTEEPAKPGEDSDASISETELDTENISAPGDSTQVESEVANSQEKNPEEVPNPPNSDEPGEPYYYPPMGDVYQLVENYAKVTMLPNKAWTSDDTIKDNFAKSKEIGEKYYKIIDKFVEALCDTPRLRTDMVMDTGNPVEDTDVYHIFFQRTDGEIVQVCIFADYGFVYFYNASDLGMKMDGDVLEELLKVLWVHW